MKIVRNILQCYILFLSLFSLVHEFIDHGDDLNLDINILHDSYNIYYEEQLNFSLFKNILKINFFSSVWHPPKFQFFLN